MSFLFSCKSENQESKQINNDFVSNSSIKEEIVSTIKDSTFNLDSLAEIWIEGELGLDKLDLVEITKKTRAKFRKINSKKNWSKIVEREIWKTLEGGIATYYLNNNSIEKIHVRNFGETFQNVKEFYFENNSMFFVFEIEYRYNRPIDYDSIKMKENNDNQVFDFDESTITETRSYFKNKNLIRQISNQDCGSPNSIELRNEEETRLLEWQATVLEVF